MKQSFSIARYRRNALSWVLILSIFLSGCATTSKSSSVGQTVGQMVAFGIDSTIDITATGLKAVSNGAKTIYQQTTKQSNQAKWDHLPRVK